MSAERYDPVNSAWKRALPPLTRQEAGRAAAALLRKFGTRDSGSMSKARIEHASMVRRVWIANKAEDNSTYKGWPRLVHDVSHRVFRYRYPNKLPHDALHARLELEVTEYVLASGWLDGKLAPKVKAKPTTEEKRAKRRANLETRLARWLTRQKRANTMVKKLGRQLRRKELTPPTP